MENGSLMKVKSIAECSPEVIMGNKKTIFGALSECSL